MQALTAKCLIRIADKIYDKSIGGILKVIIVGAGVIGMMQARELALKGVEVVLLDKGICGSEASWAGGGIISPLYPWRYCDAVTQLANWSQAYYPNLIQTLEAETDIDSELTRHGLLMLDVDDREDAVNWSKGANTWIEEIDAASIYDLEPNLRKGINEGLWMSQVASIRNPRLLKALYRFIELNPLVTVMEESEVSSLISKGSKVSGVKTAQGITVEGDKVVLSLGAWTSALSGQETIQIQPVKGQMLLFAAKPGMVNRVVLSHGRYVIPRRDGSVVAGSTLEYTGFEKQTTEQVKNELSDMAIDLFPELASCQITHHWAGLRPSSPNGVPYIGRLPNYDNAFINSGHFRNGLVLSPASVRLMTSILCEETAPIDPTPYEPSRLN